MDLSCGMGRSGILTERIMCSADVNECELMVAVCGTALCENVEGAFLCLCPSDHEEYDTEAGACRPRTAMGKSLLGTAA